MTQTSATHEIMIDLTLGDVCKLQKHAITLRAAPTPETNGYLVAIEDFLENVFDDAVAGMDRRISPRLIQKARAKFHGGKPLSECLRGL